MSNEKDNVELMIDGEKLIKLYCDRNCVGDCSDTVKKVCDFMDIVNESVIGNNENSDIEVKLLSCPLCSGCANVVGYKNIYIQCVNCKVATKFYNTIEEAAKAWNTRKPIADVAKRLEEESFDMSLENPDCKAVWLDKAIEIVKEEGAK